MITYLFTFLISVISGTEQLNLVDWNASRKLTWEDFKASPDPASTNAALTNSSITVEFEYDDQQLQFTIKCRFDKTKSWGRIRNNEILAHEQGHFDMAELHARKLNKALREYRFNPKKVSEDVNRIYDSMMVVHHTAQSEYDKETDFSRNKEKQGLWQKKIADDLQLLKAFAAYSK